MKCYFDLLKRLPLRKQFNHSNGHYHLLVGYIQSGKTDAMLLYCWESIFLHNRNVILMLRNIRADVFQLISRINSFNKNMDKKMKYNYKGNIIGNGIYIRLANHHQAAKMVDKVDNYDLCIDECDYAIKTNNGSSKLEIPLNKLKKKAVSILGVTATPIANYFSDKLITSVSRLGVPKNYIGVNDIEYRIINNYKSVESMYDNMNNDFHLVLFNGSKYRKDQYRMQEYFAKTLPEWTTIVFNCNGIFISCPWREQNYIESFKYYLRCYFLSRGIIDEVIDIIFRYTSFNFKFPFKCKLNRNHLNQKKVYKCDTIHYFKNFTIQEVLQILKNEKHSKITIFAGNLASRGVSFVSDDYQWHLTDEIYLPSKNIHGESLLQGLRLLGVYKENKNIRLWCSSKVASEIKANYNLICRLVAVSENKRNYRQIIKNTMVDRPKNALTRPSINKVKWKKQGNQFLLI